MFKCALQTHTTGRDTSYNLNVERRHKWGLEGVTLLWIEIMGGYNTPVTMVEIGPEHKNRS